MVETCSGIVNGMTISDGCILHYLIGTLEEGWVVVPEEIFRGSETPDYTVGGNRPGATCSRVLNNNLLIGVDLGKEAFFTDFWEEKGKGKVDAVGNVSCPHTVPFFSCHESLVGADVFDGFFESHVVEGCNERTINSLKDRKALKGGGKLPCSIGGEVGDTEFAIAFRHNKL